MKVTIKEAIYILSKATEDASMIPPEKYTNIINLSIYALKRIEQIQLNSIAKYERNR